MAIDTLCIGQPDDMHVHLRDGEVLLDVIRYTALVFGRAVVMPNLRPNPVLTAADASAYRERILEACRRMKCEGFEPLMTIQLTAQTTSDMIEAARAAGVVAAKFYPRHGTTNSDNGLLSVQDIPQRLLDAMAGTGMRLCVHAERPDAFILDRERLCVQDMLGLAERNPRLNIIWEHVSCEDAVQAVRCGPENLYASITAHHLVLTLDDVIGSGIQPHHYCMPVAKTPQDRDAIIMAAISGSYKFFFGSDSAPHLRHSKHCEKGAAGIFSAPRALPILAQVFEKYNALQRLQDFTSKFGAQCYGLKRSTRMVRLQRGEYEYAPCAAAPTDAIIPFRLGERFTWRVSETPNWSDM